jgi:deoxyribonuclease V
MWPADAESLIAHQKRLAAAAAEPWSPPTGRSLRVGACWVCFPRGLTGAGGAGDQTWTAVVVMRTGHVVEQHVKTGSAGAPYTPGLLALRVGQVMEDAVRGLSKLPDVLLVDGTGRDHPRRAGLAVHLGAALSIPTVGVTHRPLVGVGDWPEDRRGAASLVRIGDEVVAGWLRTQPGTRPLVAHPGWRVDVETAIEVVQQASPRWRTPEPLRCARRAARRSRAQGAPRPQR